MGNLKQRTQPTEPAQQLLRIVFQPVDPFARKAGITAEFNLVAQCALDDRTAKFERIDKPLLHLRIIRAPSQLAHPRPKAGKNRFFGAQKRLQKADGSLPADPRLKIAVELLLAAALRIDVQTLRNEEIKLHRITQRPPVLRAQRINMFDLKLVTVMYLDPFLNRLHCAGKLLLRLRVSIHVSQ